MREGVLLRVWREACKHIEIHESTASIAPLVLEHAPIERVIVRRLDVARAQLETVGSSTDGPAPPRTHLDAAQLQRVLAWCHRGRLLRRGPRGPRELQVLFPDVPDVDIVAVPLLSSESSAGVLLAVARPGVAFRDAHLELIAALGDPFSAALENDRRLHEVNALREAAEADRRSLLTRLGRREIQDAIVGAEVGLRAVFDRVEVVCRSDVPVLLVGETGTGKEVVARAIHTRSARSDRAFLRVNCGAIPSELLDSQLFGHERGSFTGAVDTHHGWFERADGGTLFLDEIGELPLAAQVRLLRVLQDGLVERVGGRQHIHVDVRVVAATHRDLPALVRRRRFREDLWYRLAVFPIYLPPLRARVVDIPALANHFAERAATRFGLPLVLPTAQDMDLLIGYSWPGNVRELAAVIDRAALLGNGAALAVSAALGAATPPAVIGPSETSDREPQPAAGSPADAGPPAAHRGSVLNDVVRRHIESVLRRTLGRIEGPFGAAHLLDVNPYTLRARMRKLGIDWTRFRPGSASGAAAAGE
ncbi:MAG: sigma 54-interacting transcriptional regulator [Phycisphaerae bacterium]